MSARNFIVGDIHGCFGTLQQLLYTKMQIEKEDNIYFLGDYIDRGPKSREVIDLLLELIETGYNIFPLLGNHESMMLNSINSKDALYQWQYNGNKETLNSFDVDNIAKIDDKYLLFFKGLKYYYELEDYVLVHAGMNFDVPNPYTEFEAMLWIRNEFVDRRKIAGRKLIVGHTPVPLEIILNTLNSDKSMLDGGCVYKNRRADLGYLVALELNSMKLYSQINIDY